MKIVHIISRLAFGGAEILAKDLALRNVDSKIKVEVWTLYDIIDNEVSNSFINEFQSKGIIVKSIGKKASKNNPKLIINIYNMLKDCKPDLIHSHIEEMSIFVQMANIFSKIPIIHTIHNNKINHKYIHKFLSLFKNYIFISISDEVKKSAKSILNIDTPIIYNGVNLDKFQFKNREYNNVQKFISIGRLTEQKNHIFLIKAFAKFIKEENKLANKPILEIYGHGELYENLLIEIKNENMSKYIKLMGVANNVDKILREAQCYILPSKWEGLSISLIEAMSSGIPIIATNISGNVGILEDNKNSIIIESDNVDNLEKGILKIYNSNILRRKIGCNARQDSKKFSIENAALKYEKLYFSILKCKAME